MADGWQADVVSGAPIASVWGNMVRDRTVIPFATHAARDAGIVSPTQGMVTIIAGKWLETYDGSAWKQHFAGLLVSDQNGSQVDCGSTPTDLAAITVTVPKARPVTVHAYCNGGQITANAGIANAQLVVPGGGPLVYAMYRNDAVVGNNYVGSGVWTVTFPAGSTTVTLKGVATGGALRVSAGNARISALT